MPLSPASGFPRRDSERDLPRGGIAGSRVGAGLRRGWFHGMGRDDGRGLGSFDGQRAAEAQVGESLVEIESLAGADGPVLRAALDDALDRTGTLGGRSG